MTLKGTMTDNPIATKLTTDGLSGVLNGLGAIGFYKAINESDYIAGLFGIGAIGLAILVMYVRNSWNEERRD